MNALSIPEELKSVPKRKLDVVFASGPEGKVYAIPLSVAAEFESDDKHLTRFLRGGEPDEVEGRHKVLLVDGTFEYNSQWHVGAYLWIVNGGSYYGSHWHPNRHSPYAHDQDG